MDWLRKVDFVILSLCLPVIIAGAESAPPNPVPTEQLLINRTGPSDVSVKRDGVPVAPEEIHVEVVPRVEEIIPTDLTLALTQSPPVTVSDGAGKKSTLSADPSILRPEETSTIQDLSSKPTALPQSPGNHRKPPSLKLELRELLELRRAAQEAGGDIEISIRPINIASEDLVVPLTRDGYFEVKEEDKSGIILVQSKRLDPYLERLHLEIARLERRRRALFSDINFLESSHKADIDPTSTLSPDHETGLGQQTSGSIDDDTRVERGAAPILRVPDGVPTAAALPPQVQP